MQTINKTGALKDQIHVTSGGKKIKLPLKSFFPQAIKRGIHFEIMYSPALKDNSVKRTIISNALSLTRVSRGKVSCFYIV